jgi:hypothetical protein
MAELSLNKIWALVKDYGFNVRLYMNNKDQSHKDIIVHILRRFNIDESVPALTEKFGQDAWGVLKKYFSMYDFYTKQCSNITATIDFKSIEYPLIYISAPDDPQDEKVNIKIGPITLNNLDESSHFFIQHFRILKLENYTLSVVKLMQIAYNSGQLLAQNVISRYDPVVFDFFTRNNLGELNTYVLEILYGELNNIRLINKNGLKGGSKIQYYKFANW